MVRMHSKAGSSPRWARVATLVSAMLALGWGGVANAKSDCDATCLEGFITQYRTALLNHDPKALPLAEGARYTENGVEIPLGEALWVTVTGLGDYRHDFADPTTGEVATLASFVENGTPGLMSLRLKVVDRKITQIEVILNRGARLAAHMPPIDPLWDKVEPASSRLTRDQLRTAAEGYMKAVSQGNGALAPFDEQTCIRFENGTTMALAPGDKAPSPTIPVSDPNSWAAAVQATLGIGCAKQLDTKIYAFITSYDNARFPIVDEVHQVVFGVFNFRRRGTVKSVTLANSKTYPMMPSTQFPNENLLGEAWKFQNGKIVRVEGVFLNANVYKAGTGWDHASTDR